MLKDIGCGLVAIARIRPWTPLSIIRKHLLVWLAGTCSRHIQDPKLDARIRIRIYGAGGGPTHCGWPFGYHSAQALVLFSIMFVLIAMGIATNTVQSGAVFAGLRKYFRCAPAFLSPIVYHFSEEQIRRQLRFLLALALLQLPAAIYQRLTAPILLGISSQEPIKDRAFFLFYCAIEMMTAFLVKRKIRLMYFTPAVIRAFISMTINETTATLFLLPLALCCPYYSPVGREFSFQPWS
jgi:hypothetical protein